MYLAIQKYIKLKIRFLTIFCDKSPLKSISNATTKEKLQFKRFNDICEEHCLIQIIEETTRKENTLDLVYTNDIGIMSHIDVNTSDISDHNKIEITTTYIDKS